MPNTIIGDVWQSLDGFQLEMIAVAENPQTPASKLAALSKRASSAIRGAVACNPGTPAKTISVLLQDKDKGVRYLAAMNPSLGVKQTRELVLSSDEAIRLGVTHNPVADVGVLAILANDTVQEIRFQACLNLGQMNDTQFAEGLIEAGYTDLVHTPRKWALKALGAIL